MNIRCPKCQSSWVKPDSFRVKVPKHFVISITSGRYIVCKGSGKVVKRRGVKKTRPAY